MSKATRDTVFFAAIGLCLLVPLCNMLRWGGAGPMDEGTVLLYPELTLKGYVPYRDFETFYGPGNVWLLAAVYKVFGANIFVERTVGLFWRLLTLVAVFQISRRWNVWVAASCIIATGLLLCCTTSLAAAVMAAIPLGLCALWSLAGAESAWRGFLSGALAGLCILCRVDFAPAILLALLPSWISTRPRPRCAFGAGAVLTLVPLVFLLLLDSSDVFANLVLYPVFHSNIARRLPISWSGSFSAKIFAMHIVGVLALFAAAFATSRKRPEDPEKSILAGLALFSLFTLPYALERFDPMHIIPAALIAIGFLPLALAVLISGLVRISNPVITSAVPGALVAISLLVIIPGFATYLARTFHLFPSSQSSQAVEPVFVWHGNRVFAFDDEQDANNVRALLAEMQKLTRPGERLFVGPADLRRTNYCDTYLYHMLPQLTPATYFLEMNPLSANRPNSRLARDIATADWLVLNRSLDTWTEPNESSRPGSDEPNAVVRAEFDPVFDCGSYIVYRKKQSARQQ